MRGEAEHFSYSPVGESPAAYGFITDSSRSIAGEQLFLIDCSCSFANRAWRMLIPTYRWLLQRERSTRDSGAAIQELCLTKGFIFWSPEEIKTKGYRACQERLSR